jgi:hypothetical protein
MTLAQLVQQFQTWTKVRNFNVNAEQKWKRKKIADKGDEFERCDLPNRDALLQAHRWRLRAIRGFESQ